MEDLFLKLLNKLHIENHMETYQFQPGVDIHLKDGMVKIYLIQKSSMKLAKMLM